MTKNRKRLLNTATLLILVAVFTWYIKGNWAKFQELSLANPVLLVPVAIVGLFNVYSLGVLLDLTIRPHGIRLSRNEVFGLSALTRFGNYVSPGYLGAVIRAVYLKRKYSMTYTKFSSSLVVSSMLQFIMSGILVLLIYALRADSLVNSGPILVIVLAMALFVLLFFMPLGKIIKFIKRLESKHNSKVLERLADALKQYGTVRSHPGLFYDMTLWVTATIASSSLILFLLYRVLGTSVEVLPVIFIMAIGGWTIIFSITPAGIGVREGLMALAAQLMGVSIPATLAAAIILRLVTFTTVSILSAYYAPKLLNTTLFHIKDIKTEEP